MPPRDDDDGDVPGAFEQLVLLAITRLGEDAYGMTVRREIETHTEREVSLGAVYATLERLERKGYVRSRAASGGRERGGRPRRLVSLEPAGLRALRRALAAVDRMRVGLTGLEPLGGRR